MRLCACASSTSNHRKMNSECKIDEQASEWEGKRNTCTIEEIERWRCVVVEAVEYSFQYFIQTEGRLRVLCVCMERRWLFHHCSVCMFCDSICWQIVKKFYAHTLNRHTHTHTNITTEDTDRNWARHTGAHYLYWDSKIRTEQRANVMHTAIITMESKSFH